MGSIALLNPEFLDSGIVTWIVVPFLIFAARVLDLTLFVTLPMAWRKRT